MPPKIDFYLPKPTSDWPKAGETYIREYRNVLSRDACERLYDLFMESPEKFEGMVGNTYAEGTINKDYKSSLDLDLGTQVNNPKWSKAIQTVKEAIANTAKRYADEIRPVHLVCADKGLQTTGPQMQYYLPNGQDGFKMHIDRGRGSTSRELAIIIYLNDVEEGGETYFPAQGIAVKPEAGKVVWFPAGFTHPHEGRTPISNPKLIITVFMVYSEDDPWENEPSSQ